MHRNSQYIVIKNKRIPFRYLILIQDGVRYGVPKRMKFGNCVLLYKNKVGSKRAIRLNN